MNFVDSVCDKNMFLCSYVKIILRCLRAKIFDNSVNFVDSVCDKICSYVLMSKIKLRCLRAKIFDNSVNFVDSVCDKNMYLCSYVKKADRRSRTDGALPLTTLPKN